MDMFLGAGMLMLPIALLVGLAPIALLVALQVWLCRKGKWLGLILPGISLAVSLLLVLSVASFGALRTTTISGGVNVLSPNGEEVVAQTEPEKKQEIAFHPRVLAATGILFLVSNIPTVVFGGIWLHYKGRQELYEDLKKMRIEDLE